MASENRESRERADGRIGAMPLVTTTRGLRGTALESEATLSANAAASTANIAAAQRLPSIDAFRGLIMVLMALDHTRAFFTNLSFEPETLSQTNLPLFTTRWVTHFCAPMFFFLAGVGAFLYGHQRSRGDLERFLWTRGVWLIVLEFTVVGTAWSFQAPWGFFGVIWALGASMVILALAVRLPLGWIAGGSVAIILAHNLADGIRPQQLGAFGWAWTLLHARGPIDMPFGIHQFVLFPLIPLTAVMAAGYSFGPLYLLDRDRRRARMIRVGLGLSVAFVILRLTSLYGNPPAGLGGVSQGDWQLQPTLAKTLILFFDVEKYPPSLQYLLMTLGPSLLGLAALDGNRHAKLASMLLVFGRVPMLFYVLHLYLIHWLAVLVAVLSGQPTRWLFHGAIFFGAPSGYGHGLPVVYLLWISAVAILYVPCRWFARLKQRRQDWWLRYL
jgi:uncharacterized membrane protein